MKLLIFFLLVINSCELFCQATSQEVLAACGGSSENGISASWTMGETVINELSIPGYMLSQGFQQGFLSVVTGNENLPDEISITAYPNPVLNSLSIKISNPSRSYHWSVNVYDYKGELVTQNTTEENITEINFNSLPPGAYLVKISNKDNFKIFNIIKQ